MTVEFELNGNSCTVDVDPFAKLIDVLRNDLALTGTKKGCGTGKCGCCQAFLNGMLVNTCLIPAFKISGTQIITIEGFSATREYMAIENAFLECGVSLCGFCSPGIVMATEALLHDNLYPTGLDIKKALAGNTCRCICYTTLTRGINMAAGLRRKGNYGRKR